VNVHVTWVWLSIKVTKDFALEIGSKISPQTSKWIKWLFSKLIRDIDLIMVNEGCPSVLRWNHILELANDFDVAYWLMTSFVFWVLGFWYINPLCSLVIKIAFLVVTSWHTQEKKCYFKFLYYKKHRELSIIIDDSKVIFLVVFDLLMSHFPVIMIEHVLEIPLLNMPIL